MNGACQVRFFLAFDEPDIGAILPCANFVRRTIAGAPIDENHLEAFRRQTERRQIREQRIEVIYIVECRNDY